MEFQQHSSVLALHLLWYTQVSKEPLCWFWSLLLFRATRRSPDMWVYQLLHRGRSLAKNQVQIYITGHQLPKTLCMHPDKTKPNCRITNLWEREDTILTTKFLDSIFHVTQQVLADTWHCWKWSCLVYSYFVPKKESRIDLFVIKR